MADRKDPRRIDAGLREQSVQNLFEELDVELALRIHLPAGATLTLQIGHHRHRTELLLDTAGVDRLKLGMRPAAAVEAEDQRYRRACRVTVGQRHDVRSLRAVDARGESAARWV